jgi:hypothetical protein
MKRLAAVLALLCVFLVALAACGATSVTRPLTIRAPEKSAAVRCPPQTAVMGCADGVAAKPTPPPPGKVGVTAPVTGCIYPDVSQWQGHPDWAAAAGHICAGVAKAGETVEDPDFAWNVATLRALHIPWGAYWFVSACGEGPAFVRVLDSVHFKGDLDALRPVLDMEIPAARGCAVPMAAAIHKAFGIEPDIYTAPGTWPGGSSDGLPVWEADYGPVLGALPFAAHVVGWQEWSPPYRFLFEPGLGYIDESLSRGYAAERAFPANPLAIYPVTRFLLAGGIRASERGTMSTWRAARCADPVRRPVCRSSRSHARLLKARLWYVAHHPLRGGKATWGYDHRGARYQGLSKVVGG